MVCRTVTENRKLAVYAGIDAAQPIHTGETVPVSSALKLRGYFPSAGADQMSDLAAHLDDTTNTFLGSNHLPLPIRVTYGSFGPQYFISTDKGVQFWSHLVLRPEKVLVEGLDETGNVLDSVSFTVTRTSDPLDRTPDLAAKGLEGLKARPKVSHDDLLQKTTDVANAYLDNDDPATAWTYIEAARKDYPDAIKGRLAEHYLTYRHDIACARADLPEALAIDDQFAATATSLDGKITAWNSAINDSLLLAHDYPRAARYWLLLTQQQGTPNADWPYYPKLSVK